MLQNEGISQELAVDAILLLYVQCLQWSLVGQVPQPMLSRNRYWVTNRIKIDS